MNPQTHRRLEHLYEISALFASFESVEHPCDRALGIAAKTLPLRSAVLIETEDGRSGMTVWPSEGRSSETMQAVKQHVGEAYAYLSGAASIEVLNLREQQGPTPLPPQAEIEESPARRLIVIPLCVPNRPPFGVLQLEGAKPLDKADLTFVNAIANQLAIALDRSRLWRREIIRRERAEDDRSRTEMLVAAAERQRLVAESLSERYEAVAAQNATLYEEARRAVRAREQILAVVSHDLKNPLSAIIMTADGLAKTGVSEERRRGQPQAIARIQRAAQRMHRLVEDLLDFASIEAGHLSLGRQQQDAEPMVHETLAAFESAALDKGLWFTAEVEPELRQAYCDRDRILQVLSNLVGNAAKAVAHGGHVTLRLRSRGDELLFSVEDDGPGIKEHEIKHLFDRYWRGGEAHYKGTGLGLAIAGGIVGAHGGRIWAESEPGRGAKFHFTVPTLKDAGAEDASKSGER